jgi:hypothetical protein
VILDEPFAASPHDDDIDRSPLVSIETLPEDPSTYAAIVVLTGNEGRVFNSGDLRADWQQAQELIGALPEPHLAGCSFVDFFDDSHAWMLIAEGPMTEWVVELRPLPCQLARKRPAAARCPTRPRRTARRRRRWQPRRPTPRRRAPGACGLRSPQRPLAVG